MLQLLIGKGFANVNYDLSVLCSTSMGTSASTAAQTAACARLLAITATAAPLLFLALLLWPALHQLLLRLPLSLLSLTMPTNPLLKVPAIKAASDQDIA